jgi:hypothetical protein
MAQRRQLSPFNLAFLDIMFCGFGAVVLLVLLVNSQLVRSRNEQHEDLRAEVSRLEHEVQAGELYLEELQADLQASEEERAGIRDAIHQEREAMILLTGEMQSNKEQSRTRKKKVDTLAQELKKLDAEQIQLAQKIPVTQGSKARRFEGEGNRQYLTGLKLGGKRVLILIDGSASMLDTSVVNVIRRRNMDKATQLASKKWQQVQKTVRWLLANLPVSSSVQLMVFNTQPLLLTENKKNAWVPVTDKAVNGMLTRFRDMVPTGGTSLENAFAAASALQPRPDNILLLTDGLPTQGKTKPRKNLISGVQRGNFFAQAIKILPHGVPVNTVLFPMEGDPLAAISYWQLAILTRGSFFTPTADWP